MEAKDGKNKMMMIIIILLLVITLGTIGGVSWYVLTRLNQEPEVIEVTPPPLPGLVLEDLVVFSAGRITRNLLNLNPGMRGWMAAMDVSFQIDSSRDPDGELYELMHTQIDMIRDIIITLVGNYTYNELIDPNGLDILREHILVAVSEQLHTNLIVRVNISHFMMSPV